MLVRTAFEIIRRRYSCHALAVGGGRSFCKVTTLVSGGLSHLQSDLLLFVYISMALRADWSDTEHLIQQKYSVSSFFVVVGFLFPLFLAR